MSNGTSSALHEVTGQQKKSLFARLRAALSFSRHWFSNWIHTPARQREVLYPQHDEATIADEIDLSRRAEQSGKQELPHTDQSREASALEQVIDSHIVGLLNDARTRATRTIVIQDKAFKKISTAGLTARIGGIKVRVDSEFKRVFTNASGELATLSTRTEDAAREFDDFRVRHGRLYQAKYPESRILGWAILVVILIAETALNAVFFAEGSDLGLLGGFGQALSLSIVNIALAGLVAHYPLRWIAHRHTALRLLGSALCLVYLMCLSFFLLFISRYRHAFTTEPEAAFDLAMQAIRNGTWFPESEASLVFLLLSVFFAVFALFDVYRLDDSYPGYGRIQRNWENARDEELNRHKELSQELEVLSAKLQHEQELVQRELNERLHWLDTISTSCEEALTGWDPYVARVRQLRRALLASSRQLNMAARSTLQPAWFQKNVPLDDKVYRPPLRAIPDTDPIRCQIGVLQAESKEFKQLLIDRYTEARECLNAMSTMQKDTS